MEREFTRSTNVLIIGEIITFVLNFASGFFLIRFFSVEEYAVYNIVIVFPVILLYVGDFGLYHGCSYYVARLGKLEKKKEIRNVIKITLIAKTILGIGLAILIFFLAEGISSSLIRIQYITIVPILQFASILLITLSLSQAIFSILLGSTKMKFFTFLNVVRYATQFVLIIVLVLFGWNVFGAIMGMVLSTGIIGLVGLFYIRKNLLKHSGKRENIEWNCLPQLVKRGFSYSLVSIIQNVRKEVFVIFLILFGFYSEVSYLKAGVSIISIFYIILRPVVLSLFPIFSKYSWNNPSGKQILKNVFQYSNKFCSLFISPVIIFSIVFAFDLIPLVFGMDYQAGTQFISVFFVYFLPLTIGMAVLPSFFYGQGYSGLSFLIEFFSFCASLIIGILLSLFWGSLGYALGISLGAFLGLIFGIFMTNRKFGKELFSNIKDSIFIVIIASILCVLFFIVYYSITLMIVLDNFVIKLLILGGIFVFFYILFLITLIRVKLLKYHEIFYFIREFQKVPLVNKVLNFIVRLGKRLWEKKDD